MPKTETVGLKIGASRIAAARVAVNGGARLLQVEEATLAPGVVARGEVQDVGGLSDALKRFFAVHKLPHRAVRLGVASNRIGVRTIEVTGVSTREQLSNAVLFRAQEDLPIPINEAVLDYQVVSERVTDGETTKRVLLAVAYRDLVESFAAACSTAGIRLVGVDLEAFALLRALVSPPGLGSPGEDPGAIVAVAIGSERTTIAVSEGYACEYARVIEWGGAVLTKAITEALNIEFAHAERLKLDLSLVDGGVPDGATEAAAAATRAAIEAGVQSFAREIVSTLHYYQSQDGSLAIREVLLAGGGARLDGLAPMLERLMGVPVRIGDPTTRLDQAGALSADQPGMAVPIGLGMGR